MEFILGQEGDSLDHTVLAGKLFDRENYVAWSQELKFTKPGTTEKF